jgi:hypothetical protein
MTLAVTVPFATPPEEDTGAVLFLEHFKESLNSLEISHYVIEGESPKGILNLSTKAAKTTEYSKDFSTVLLASNLHIDIQSYNYETYPDEDWINRDVVLGVLPTFTDTKLLGALKRHLIDVSSIYIKDLILEFSYASVLSELIFDVKSIPLYLNENSVALYPVIAEKLAEFVDQIGPLDYSDTSSEDNLMQH